MQNNKDLDRIATFIKHLRTTSSLSCDPFAYIDDCHSGRDYVYFVKSHTCKRISSNAMKRYKASCSSRQLDYIKFIQLKETKLMIIGESNTKFTAQALTTMLSNTAEALTSSMSRVFELIGNVTSGTVSTLTAASRTFSTLFTQDFKLFILDIFSFLFKLKDSYFTPYTIFGMLISLYTLHTRYLNIFKAQAGPDTFDILFGTSAILGIPSYILDHIKTFTTLTGKRLFDADIVMDVMHKILTSLKAIVMWISEPVLGHRMIPSNITEIILNAIDVLGGSVFMHAHIRKICAQYTKYVGNSSVLFDPTFRKECTEMYDSCKKNNNFMAYITNNNNRYFFTTWQLYEKNLIKSCHAFDQSSRDEPLCFVFEGEAGTGKSTIMNNFIDLLRSKGLTTYCHSVPAAEDGKDFYDDYENQDIFVMDDVGQQGVSQWRYIINYVSPVKYPLPCAAADKKNTKFFNSKFIFCTTNHFRSLHSFTSSDCISEPEALFRRCHVIDVSAEIDNNNNFTQFFKYFKYDYKYRHAWVNDYIYHFKQQNKYELPINFNSSELKAFNGFSTTDHNRMVLAKLYTIFSHIRKCHEADIKKVSMSNVVHAAMLSTLDNAIDDDVQFHDALDNFQPQFFSFSSSTYLGDIVGNITFENIYSEYLLYYTNILIDSITRISNYIYELLVSCLAERSITYGQLAVGAAFSAGVLIMIQYFFFSKDKTNFVELNNLSKRGKLPTHLTWGPQSGPPERIENIKKFCKTLVVRPEKAGQDYTTTQCVVSGTRVLLPAHIIVQDRFVDIYQTYEHFKNKHSELENVRLKKLKCFMSCDLAVYEIVDIIPLYKLNRNIFNFGSCNNPNLYLINSSGMAQVLLNDDIVPNDQKVTYSTCVGKMEHEINSGFYTPYSADGGCGTVLASSDAGIIGFHVAGNNSIGFCVTPSENIRKEINALMLAAPATSMDLDPKIIYDFSGVRMRYVDPINVQYVSGETSLVPTVMHVNCNEGMQELVQDIIEDPGLTPIKVNNIEVKVPPNFSSAGNPTKTMKKMAAKTFRHQGIVSNKELEFLKSYIRTLMVPFNDLEDQEVAFGGEFVKPINKDSSNGYGCLKGKDNYFDFENKIIKPEAVELFESFQRAAKEKDYSDFSKYVCRETFKDELRMPNKADKPRTFRVMPLGHIWWTKKIFGKLVKHFKSTMHDTGISVGFNPYKDMDVLAKKLKQCDITGDIDFGKWDGSILALFMMAIAEVFAEFYEGDYEYMINYLFVTMARSFVIVADELWSTTHGLPSGTWLTLLVNCLLNKMLTALVIYRNKENATIHDVNSVIDYVMGDDKIIGASGEMAKIFNLHTINEVATSLGMECTNGDKTPIVAASHPFEKLTFVKRNFHKHPTLQKYVGALSIETLTSTLMWRDASKDISEVMIGKMRSVLVESYLHSPALAARFRNEFERIYPFEPFFTDDRIIKILSSDDGYDFVLKGLGKDFHY